MPTHYKNIMKEGIITKKGIIHDHFACMLRNAYIDRILRNSFINRTDATLSKNVFKFNLYSQNDLTAICELSQPTGAIDVNQLADNVVQNRIDLVISINQKNNDIKSVTSSIMKIIDVEEQRFNREIDLNLQKVTFKTNDYPHELKFAHAVINNFKMIQTQATTQMPGTPLEYAPQTNEAIAWLIMKTLNSKNFPEKRIILVCDDLKMTAVLLMSLINFFQAKHEDTMNINMAAQTILAKLPKDNFKNLPQLIDKSENKDYETFYKSIFELVSVINS